MVGGLVGKRRESKKCQNCDREENGEETFGHSVLLCWTSMA
jgi:hypothetical protein